MTTGASSGNTVTGADRDEAATVRDSAENGTETNLELLVTSTATSKTTTTAREDGNVVSGDYELTATETTVAASSVSRTNRELVITSTVTSDGSSTTTETGNSFAGAFVLQTAGSGVTNEVEVETNQGLRMESRTTAASVSGMLDRGNSVTGDHDLATDDGTTTVSTVVKTNGPLTVNTTLTVTSAVSAAETSNEHSGEYELTATETTVVQETSEQTNGELTAGSATDATSTVTTEEAGNTVTGDFEAFVSTTSHSAVVSHLANQGLRSDTKATTAVEGEADESGNTVAGDATRQGTDTVITVTEVTSVNGALTAKAKTTVTDKVESTDTSNSITGVFSKHVTVNRTITGTSTDVNGPLTVTGETEGAEEGTTAETGNTLDGSYEITEDWTGSVTVSQEGRNGVRTWEVTQTTETTLRHVEQTGNDLSGAFTYDETTAQTVTVEETATFSNGGQDTLGRETTNDVTLRETGNVVTGEYERSVEKTTQATTQQAGQRGGGAYTATATEDGRFASVETGNTLTGAFHAEESSRTTTERRQTAPFTLTVSSTLTVTGERDGNQISGAYGSEATIREDETLAERGNGFSVDQTRTVATTETETGNSVTGSYGADLTRRTTLSYTQTSGPLFVTQSSQENESGTRTGNRIAGTFSEVVSGTETYQLRENGSIGPNNFNLPANGTRRFSTTLTTDERTGGYSKSETGTETVSMLETGTRQVRILNRPRNLAFREQLNVNATYQQQESGNVVSGAFTRTTAGRDNFRRIETGLGALLEHILQPVGQANFAVTENGNLHTGQLNLSKTGTTRYDLLVLFGDASTTNGKGPGTVSFVPVGRPYHVGEGQISSGDGGGNAGTALGEISDGQLLAMAQSLEAYVQLGAEDYYKACFAAGTPIRTRAGWKLIEDIAVGDEVWSRHERDPDGPLALKHVEELFLRQAAVWHLHVGGEVLRTTAEHPFWVRGLGWRQCQELKVGQELRTADGWIVVEDVCDAGEWLPVYNFRVAEWHTYFVGDDARQAIWVHNSIYDVETKLSDVSNTRQSKVRQAFALAAQAEATSMSLKGDFRGKCVAASNGRNTISGYEETGQPPGFEAITPDQVAKQAALIGYPLRGHGNDSSGSGPSWSGKYFASHAEKKMAVANLSNLSLPIGVSQDQCTDCGAGSGANPNSFFRSLAMAKGMDLVVASPTTARIFTSTGTVLLFRQ